MFSRRGTETRRVSPGSGGRARRVFATISAAAVGVIVAGSVSAPANASSTNNLCEFGVFIAVRGTGAPAGSSLAHSNRVWLSGGQGDQVADLKARLASAADPMPFYFESLNYPASDGAPLIASVAAGRKALVNELNWLSNQCGSRLPAVVLAGHSQGAMVITQALSAFVDGSPNLTAKAKAMIRAVALFGDPNYSPTDPFDAPSSPTVQPLLHRTAGDSAALAAYRYKGWPQGSKTQGWVYKIREYCLAGDEWCQSGTSPKARAIHNAYAPSQTGPAQLWIDYMLTASQ